MPCDTRPETQTEEGKRVLADATRRLEAALAAGTVQAVIGAQGGIAFRGWREGERGGLTDLCAYRRLRAANSPELRRALARAEVLAGRTVNEQAINAGVHSHDGGHTWGSH
jgi:hypothetical protein